MSNKFRDLRDKIEHADRNHLTFTDEEVGTIYDALQIANAAVAKYVPLSVDERRNKVGKGGEIKHYPIGVNADGQGPVLPEDPDYARTVCWCGEEGCEAYK